MIYARVFRYGFLVGWTEFRRQWSWRTWLAGWMVRILAQAAFFVLIGGLMRVPDQAQYLAIGNGVAVGALAAMWGVPASAWDRADGTYPLLVVAPASLVPAILGRTSIWLLNGAATSVLSLSVLALLFDLQLQWARVLLAVPLVFLTCASVYSFALVLGALVSRAPNARTLVEHSALTFLVAFCGVNVPVEYWPTWLQVLVQGFPLTHGLEAIRMVVNGAGILAVLPDALGEAAVGLCWLALAFVIIDRMANAGRADGSIEFVS